MKRIKATKRMVVILLLAVEFAGCGDEENTNGQITTRNVFDSGCKSYNNAKETNSLTKETETITFTAGKGGWLHVEHKNTLFNCCSDKISVEVSQDDNIITVNEDENDQSCNCICPFDVEYEIGSLENTTYTLVIRRGGIEFFRQTVTFADDLKKTYIIE